MGDRCFVEETYVKVAGVWRYVCRAVGQHGQVIDVCVPKRRDIGAARGVFGLALAGHGELDEAVTGLAQALESGSLSWSRTRSVTPTNTRTIASSATTAVSVANWRRFAQTGRCQHRSLSPPRLSIPAGCHPGCAPNP